MRDLNEFYAAARRQFDADPDFAERCRQRVVLLQGGDDETLRLWRIFVAEIHAPRRRGLRACSACSCTDDDIVGESFYNPLLPVVVDELDAKGLLVEDDGALCVFPEGFENRNGEPLPLIVRKSDGGYGYPATDLACVRDRTGRVGATTAGLRRGRRAVAAPAPGLRGRPRWPGTCPTASAAVHCRFGLVLGTDGKKLASRSGGSERLDRPAGRGGRPRRRRAGGALERPVARAAGRHRPRPRRRVRSSTPTSPPSGCATTSSTGTACWPSRATPGPTCSTRTPASAPSSGGPRWRPPPPGAAPLLGEPQERALALQLLGFAAAVEATAETYSPSKLCTYLFDLATVFTAFYEACRVLVDDEAVRTSRLALCDLTARVLEQGLSLLGMEAPEQM